MITLERQLFGYFESVKNYLRAQPLMLAGVPGPSGGIGGPPGGIIGQLPQTAITYDMTEAGIWGLPPSGLSLLDNLNRIRHRLSVLEASGIGGAGSISIEDDTVLVASGVTVINFGTYLDVTLDSPGHITVDATGGGGEITIKEDGQTKGTGITTINMTGHVDVTVSGVVANIYHPIYTSGYLLGTEKRIDYYNVNSATTQFMTTYPYIVDTLQVYWNGLKQFNEDFTQTLPASGIFTMGFTVPSGTLVVADYMTYATASGGNGIGDYYVAWNPDAPPITVNSHNDEFRDKSFDTTLWSTFDNTSTLTKTENDYGLSLTTTSYNHIQGIYQTCSGVGMDQGWSLYTKVSWLSPQINNQKAGLLLIEDVSNPTTSDLIYLAAYTGSGGVGIQVETYSDYTTYTGSPLNFVNDKWIQTWYLRLRATGGSWYFDYSSDGRSWMEKYNMSRSWTPEAFGLCIRVDHLSPIPIFHWFRYETNTSLYVPPNGARVRYYYE